jgi:hypothetical protein
LSSNHATTLSENLGKKMFFPQQTPQQQSGHPHIPRRSMPLLIPTSWLIPISDNLDTHLTLDTTTTIRGLFVE